MKGPTRLHLEITNRCNSPCTTCIRTLSPDAARDLSLGEIETIVDGLPELESVALQVNGEPLLHPQLPAIVSALTARGIKSELNTNGLLLGSGHADALIAAGLAGLNVSVEATTRSTYEELRGVDSIAKVVAGLETFMTLRGPAPATPRVSLWMTVTQRTMTDLPRLVDLAVRVGAEEVYMQRFVYFDDLLAREEESLHGRLTRDDRDLISEAQRRADRGGVVLRACGWHAPQNMLNVPRKPEHWRTCRRPWEGSVVMANGDVVPCCISTFTGSRSDIVMGNVLRDGWPRVWDGAAYRDQRARMSEGEPPPHCVRCGDCWSL